MRAAAIITIITFFAFTANAQSQKKNSGGGGAGYSTGVGLRFGWDGGITAKHFIKDDAAIEGILSRAWGYRGFRITGLYEIQKPLPNAENFYWFVGGGAHFGMYGGGYWGGYYKKKGTIYYYDYNRYYPTFGLDLIGGLEYKFAEAPFTLGVDLKPYFDLWGWGGHFWDGAFTARYTF